MTQGISPFDDLRDLVGQLVLHRAASGIQGGKPDNAYVRAHGASHFQLWLANCQDKPAPEFAEIHICVLASSYDEETKHIALSFIDEASRGKATVNALCKDRGIGLRVLEMAPSIPHKAGEDWSEKDCMAAVAFGMEAAAAGGDLLGLSDCAPGSKTHAMKIIEAINIKENQIVNDETKENNLSVDPLAVLREHGGREIAGMVGAFIAAKTRCLPVLVEGWSALAALHILTAMDSSATGHIQVASYSDQAQKEIALVVGKLPIIGQPVEMGSGCGIAIAVSAMMPLMQLPLS